MTRVIPAASWAPTDLRISKSSVARFGTCRLWWAYEQILRRDHDRPEPESASRARGFAGHQAIAAILREGGAGASGGAWADDIIERACEQHGVPAGEWSELGEAVMRGVEFAGKRGGEVIALEQPLRYLRLADAMRFVGRVDLMLRHGDAVEVIDWTFGRARVEGEDAMCASPGWAIYARLAARWTGARSLILTEARLMPALDVVSIEARTRDDLAEGFVLLERAATEMREAARGGDVTPTPGLHCGWCPYGPACPVAGQMTKMVREAGDRAGGHGMTTTASRVSRSRRTRRRHTTRATRAARQGQRAATPSRSHSPRRADRVLQARAPQ